MAYSTRPVPRNVSTAPWRLFAACRGLDPEVFYPLPGEPGSTTLRERAAKRVCAQCPVAAHCLSWAVRNGEDWGIWGGTNARERRTLRAEAARNRPPAATPVGSHDNGGSP